MFWVKHFSGENIFVLRETENYLFGRILFCKSFFYKEKHFIILCYIILYRVFFWGETYFKLGWKSVFLLSVKLTRFFQTTLNIFFYYFYTWIKVIHLVFQEEISWFFLPLSFTHGGKESSTSVFTRFQTK